MSRKERPPNKKGKDEEPTEESGASHRQREHARGEGQPLQEGVWVAAVEKGAYVEPQQVGPAPGGVQRQRAPAEAAGEEEKMRLK